MAVAFVASLFYIRTGIAAFGAVDPALPDAARTLGAGPGRRFARVALPLAASGLVAGGASAFARGVGEFGATIMFAGNLQGGPRPCPSRSTSFDAISTPRSRSIALLVILSGGVLLLRSSAHMETLSFDFSSGLVPSPSSEPRGRTRARCDRRPVGRGQDTLPRARRAPAARRGPITLGDEAWFDDAAGASRYAPQERSVSSRPLPGYHAHCFRICQECSGERQSSAAAGPHAGRAPGPVRHRRISPATAPATRGLGGEHQRVALRARAGAGLPERPRRPAVLLCSDEPFVRPRHAGAPRLVSPHYSSRPLRKELELPTLLGLTHDFADAAADRADPPLGPSTEQHAPATNSARPPSLIETPPQHVRRALHGCEPALRLRPGRPATA